MRELEQRGQGPVKSLPSPQPALSTRHVSPADQAFLAQADTGLEARATRVKGLAGESLKEGQNRVSG